MQNSERGTEADTRRAYIVRNRRVLSQMLGASVLWVLFHFGVFLALMGVGDGLLAIFFHVSSCMAYVTTIILLSTKLA